MPPRIRVLLLIPVRPDIRHGDGQRRSVPPLLSPVLRTMHGIGTHTRREPRNLEARILISTLSPLVSLTKKTGIYTVIIACILTMLVVTGRKVRLRLAGTVLASAIVMFLILPGILFPLCHIVAGGKQEMIAVPLQQSALLLKEHGDELSQADRDVFAGILEPDAANKFFWPAVDPIKGTHWTAQRERLLKPFLRVWLRNGVRYPATYLRAYFLLEQGWVAMSNQAAYKSIYSGMFPCQVTHCSTRG